MKKNFQKVPEFDEIIFENRNKSYGAYDLRKKYRSSALISLVGGIIFFSIPFLLSFFFPEEPVKAVTGPGTVVILKVDNTIDPSKIIVPPPEPAPVIPRPSYIAPVIVDETADPGTLMVNDIAVQTITNGVLPESIDSISYVLPAKEISEDPEPVTFVEEPPVFPGGEEALLKFIAENTIYPQEALENNIEGKVFVKFAVAADGSVKRVEVFRSVNPLLDAEAKRVVSTLPAWKPGRQNGIAVPVWFYVPVTFRIYNN
jgi:protein TonB